MADAFDELDFEYVTGVAEKAMGAITTQRVPPTPHNFHVWFKYALGTPVELKLALMPGPYTIDLAMHHAVNRWTIDTVERAIEFEVVDRDAHGERRPNAKGFVRPAASWQHATERSAVDA